MSKFVVMAGWDDVPHLDEQTKKDLYASIPPYQRDARSKGIPQLGSGAIYPVPESEIVCKPFEIPRYWPRCYALDVGWNRTAAIWGAWNLDEDKVFLYAEHYRSQAEPAIHAASIRGRGAWIPGVIDPAARGQPSRWDSADRTIQRSRAAACTSRECRRGWTICRMGTTERRAAVCV